MNRRFQISYLTWFGLWVVFHTIAIRLTFQFDWSACIIDGVLTTGLIGGTGYAMISIMRVYQPRQSIRVMMSVGAAALCMLIMKQFVSYTVDASSDYYLFVERSIYLRTLYLWIMITLISAITWLWFTLREQQEVEARKTDTEKLAREAELSRIRQQLQPHFLFNSLNSISALAGSKPEQARKMIQQLSDFLRGTLKKDDQQLVPLSEELEHLNLYLEIEKVRFGHRLSTNTACEDAALAMKIPALLLQPVVENAIKFGLYDTTGQTVIEIRAWSSDGYLHIAVSNPFDPVTAQPKAGTGFGLSSIQRRLSLLFARPDLLSTKQEENIFTTSIKIPQSA